MSQFGVTVEEVASVQEIQDSRNLDVVKLKGLMYQMVVQRGQLKVGELVFYFPEDSILTPEFVSKYASFLKPNKKGEYIVQTIKLRGVPSQGLVFPVNALVSRSESRNLVSPEPQPNYWTDRFGVTKYQPPEIEIRGDSVGGLPKGMKVYDIESVQRNSDWFNAYIAPYPWYGFEKIEGQHIEIFCVPGELAFVCSRNCRLGNDSYYYQVAKRQGLLAKAEELAQQSGSVSVLFGELIGPGIQKNIYGLKEKKVVIFDIMTASQFWSVASFLNYCNTKDIETPSIVCYYTPAANAVAWLADDVVKMAEGKSTLADVYREALCVSLR